MEWAEEIKAHVEDYVEKKSRIGKAISGVLSNLVVSPYGYKSKTEITASNPLTWEVEMNIPNVGRLVRFEITINEITEEIFDRGRMISTGIPSDLEDKLKRIIVEKVKAELSF